MSSTPTVVVIGLRRPEFRRLEQKVAEQSLSVSLVPGGHIDDGSNSCRDARNAVESADLILINTGGTRYLGSLDRKKYRPITSVSSAMQVLQACLKP